MRCLVVDDCRELADLWRLELEELGFVADVAHGAEAAFSLMLTERYHLVVTDLGLPDGSGLTVAQSAAIRAPEAAVVIVTANADYPNGELFALSSNIAGVFRKKTDMSELFAFVAHLREKLAHPAPAPAPPEIDAAEEEAFARLWRRTG